MLWVSGLGAGLVATALNSGIAAVARRLLGVSETFAPFTLGPVLAGSVAGALGVVGTFSVLRRLTERPLLWLLAISAVLLLASVRLPLGLLDSTSPRFEGANYRVVAVLFLMHTVVATCSVGQVYLRTRRRGQ
ncbi:MAG: hypothetical protein ACFB50_18720 [Rubrobacteraceae bacterium]